MKQMCVAAGALCILAVCAVALPTEAGAAGEGLAALGNEGFSAASIGDGFAAESAPMLLAKRKKKKKKKEDDGAVGGGGSVRIDPNTASVSELKVLPLVDEATAQAIIARRPYKAAEDLAAVPEVGPCKYRIFKHLIEVKQPEDAGGTARDGAEKTAP
ncbi:MAG: helix-hairpin-helix domain-containing protein [Candidatus Aureabacteria bacterium]|nr:helix-hairpin-helix domain-containing protein [Candidatus Auribacterota bacterium]NLW94959.1 hypothetical protein [Chlamydiota bacterium]HOE26830.1 helix-hairpin-helix domain-containing protein [bacterium]HQM52694.1 helix-hairpin-helix domain-containing protein [bacterium]